MKKRITNNLSFLLLLLILCFATHVNAQFLHFGIKTFISPSIKMDYYPYNNSEYVFYFANNENETLRFTGFKSSQISTNIPYPDIYLKYESKNNFFYQFDLYGFWFTNEANFYNSVDVSEFSQTFNPENNDENLSYNSIKLKWRFLGASLLFGYKFLKTKSIRPEISLGLNSLYLFDFKPGEYFENTRSNRNAIIFNNLSTFKKFTYYYKISGGIDYKGFSTGVFFQQGFNGALDIYADKDEVLNHNLYNRNIPNYKNLEVIGAYIGLNLYSICTKSDNTKQKIKQLKRY